MLLCQNQRLNQQTLIIFLLVSNKTDDTFKGIHSEPLFLCLCIVCKTKDLRHKLDYRKFSWTNVGMSFRCNNCLFVFVEALKGAYERLFQGVGSIVKVW